MLARIRKAQEENEGGFTLIELLVVIIIIGILAAIAIPVFLNQRQKGYDAQAKSDLRNVATGEESYFTDNNAYTETVGNGAACAPATAVCYKKSANTSDVSASWVTSTGAIGTGVLANKANGYCLWSTSDSNKVFYYNSVKGGLQPTGTAAC
jgi:type IV pilus assembly protein PilA